MEISFSSLYANDLVIVTESQYHVLSTAWLSALRWSYCVLSLVLWGGDLGNTMTLLPLSIIYLSVTHTCEGTDHLVQANSKRPCIGLRRLGLHDPALPSLQTECRKLW